MAAIAVRPPGCFRSKPSSDHFGKGHESSSPSSSLSFLPIALLDRAVRKHGHHAEGLYRSDRSTHTQKDSTGDKRRAPQVGGTHQRRELASSSLMSGAGLTACLGCRSGPKLEGEVRQPELKSDAMLTSIEGFVASNSSIRVICALSIPKYATKSKSRRPVDESEKQRRLVKATTPTGRRTSRPRFIAISIKAWMSMSFQAVYTLRFLRHRGAHRKLSLILQRSLHHQ